MEADQLWSTIPVTLLARMLGDAAARCMSRLEAGIPGDDSGLSGAPGFPLYRVRRPLFSRRGYPDAGTEPKNYADLDTPVRPDGALRRAALQSYDPWWTMDDAGLAALVTGDLAAAGVPLPAAPVAVHVRKLREAYPVYRTGYERWFRVLDDWVEGIPRLLSWWQVSLPTTTPTRPRDGLRGRGLSRRRPVRHHPVGRAPPGVRDPRGRGLKARPR